jgi:plasmid stabilization system protein ParE
VKVVYSAEALASLGGIWYWNAQRYGRGHADSYIRFLRAETDKLAAGSTVSRQVPASPRLRFITIRRRTGGHGHIAVFSLNDESILIVDYFHSAEDWQKHVSADQPET